VDFDDELERLDKESLAEQGLSEQVRRRGGGGGAGQGGQGGGVLTHRRKKRREKNHLIKELDREKFIPLVHI